MVGSTHYFKEYEPTTFDEILGQDRVIKQVKTAIFAAKKRNENIIPPMLYYGPPGTGKTTLAHITSKEMNRDIMSVPASTLQKCDDLICKFVTMKDYSIFFIDEIHRLSNRIEEFIYTILDGTTVVLDYLKVKPFSFIGATTMPGALSKPFRDRFSVKAQFSLYSDDDIKEIILHTAQKAKINIDEKCCKVLSFCSRGTPRIALQHLKAVLDCATIRVNAYYEDEIMNISYDDIVEYMQTYDIDKRG